MFFLSQINDGQQAKRVTAVGSRRDIRKALMAAVCAGMALSFPATPAAAQGAAQNFPSRPMRMLIPNEPGGPTDIVARLLGTKFHEAWGQAVIADNRPGATGLIAAEALAKSAPDGHTMILMAMTQLLGTLVAQRHNLSSDFAAVSMVGTTPFAIAVPAAIPVKTVGEWVAYAKARPDQLMYASSGAWGSSHLCIEAFNEQAGIKMTHVPHKSTPLALGSLVSGQVQMFCPAAPSVRTLAKAGKIRVLGVTYQKPTELLPGVPPISDTLRGYELLGWYGLQVPLKTSPEIISRINAEVVKTLKMPDITKRLSSLGIEPVGSSAEEFSTFLRKESDRWTKILKDRNVKPNS